MHIFRFLRYIYKLFPSFIQSIHPFMRILSPTVRFLSINNFKNFFSIIKFFVPLCTPNIFQIFSKKFPRPVDSPPGA